MAENRKVILETRGLTKHYGGVQALNDADFKMYADEHIAIVGDNGAGKSTILKVLNGVHIPTAGTIEVAGVPLTTHTPAASRAAGIAMNYQEMSLIPTLTVAQNVFLTREPLTGGMINDKEAERKAAELQAEA